MEYRFLSDRRKSCFVKRFGPDFDLLALANRPRELKHNIKGEPYLSSLSHLFHCPGIGEGGRAEVIAELAAAGFVFHEGIDGNTFYHDLCFCTRKQLTQTRELLAGAGLRNSQLEEELARRKARGPYRAVSREERAQQKRKAALTKRIAAYREKIAKAEDELRALDEKDAG